MLRRQSQAESKFESKFVLLTFIWQSLPQAVPEDNQRFLTAKWMAELAQLAKVGQASINTKCSSFLVACKLQPAVTGHQVATGHDSLTWGKISTTLGTLTEFESQRVFMVCKFLAETGQRIVQNTNFFSCEMKISMVLSRTCYLPKQHWFFHSIFQSFINNQHAANQSCAKQWWSRSKLMASQRKGCLLRFQSTAQPLWLGSAQKLRNISGISGMILINSSQSLQTNQ